MYGNVERKFKNKFIGAITFSTPLAMSVMTYISSVNPKPVFQSDLSKRSEFFAIFSSLKNPYDTIHTEESLHDQRGKKLNNKEAKINLTI